MLYADLVSIYQALEKTTKRLEKTDIIASFLRKVPAEELAGIINLLQGRVFPQWDARNLGFSSRLMVKAVSKATGTSTSKVEASWNKIGDLGKVTAELINKKTQVTLVSQKITVNKLITNLQKLESIEGAGTVDRKIGLIAELLTSAKPEEARFITRTVLEELRVGIAAGIVRDAIAKACNKEPKEIEQAFDLTGDYGEVAVQAKKDNLSSLKLKAGRPVNSMLSILVQNVQEGLKALGSPAQFEPKLDGFRLQIHKARDKVKLFTRRLEEVTAQFPEVVDYIKTHVKADACILDAEAVGYDPKTGRHQPFQHISQRIKRKYDIEAMAKKLPVEINVFDVLLHNKKSYMASSLKERRKVLEKIIKNEKQKIQVTEALITSNIKEAQAFYQKSLDAGNEGVMIKNITTYYRPGRYVNGWCKLKPTLEPLDLVIVSALWGEGKRSEWLASFTVACRSKEKFLELGRVGTGVKEKAEEGVSFKELTKLLKPLITSQKGREVQVKPRIVVEISYEELQKSPTYTSGYAMRFPRVLRLRTKEKTEKDVNTLQDVERIYFVQKGKTTKKKS